MGEMADYYSDFYPDFDELDFDSDYYDNCYKGDSYKDMIWTDKHGKEILISDMNNRYLTNVKNMLKEKGWTKTKIYKRICSELKNKPDFKWQR